MKETTKEAAARVQSASDRGKGDPGHARRMQSAADRRK